MYLFILNDSVKSGPEDLSVKLQTIVCDVYLKRVWMHQNALVCIRKTCCLAIV